MKRYLVGGAVRDKLLELPVKDRDWVVVGSSEAEMLAAGYRRVDQTFPVFLHPETNEEYALARREIKSGPGYKGFTLESGPDVSLEEDLKRRDLTINALAEDENGRLIDPYGGLEDLRQGLLRHVSPAFVEDPVRLLRVARFSARLAHRGFRVAHGTHKLMRKMADSDDLKTLQPERLWSELKGALGEPQPWRFFQVLHGCGALAVLIPELALTLGPPRSHGPEAGSPAIAALMRACEQSEEPEVRFAVVIWETVEGMDDPGAFLRRLRVERGYLDLLQMMRSSGARYRALGPGAAEETLALLESGRALQQPRRFERFLSACGACWPDHAVEKRSWLEQALTALDGVSTEALQRQGLEGAALGRALHSRRLTAIEQLAGGGGVADSW